MLTSIVKQTLKPNVDTQNVNLKTYIDAGALLDAAAVGTLTAGTSDWAEWRTDGHRLRQAQRPDAECDAVSPEETKAHKASDR
jgi:hypothetical protein